MGYENLTKSQRKDSIWHREVTEESRISIGDTVIKSTEMHGV